MIKNSEDEDSCHELPTTDHQAQGLAAGLKHQHQITYLNWDMATWSHGWYVRWVHENESTSIVWLWARHATGKTPTYVLSCQVTGNFSPSISATPGLLGSHHEPPRHHSLLPSSTFDWSMLSVPHDYIERTRVWTRVFFASWPCLVVAWKRFDERETMLWSLIRNIK